MFATLHSGLPAPPPEPPLESPPDARAAVAAAVAAQLAAGLEPVTDGDLAGGDATSLVLAGLAGIEIGPSGRHEVRGAVAWRGPLLVEAWRLAIEAARGPDGVGRAAKAQLPGPYSLARRLAPEPSRVEPLALALAETLNQEIRALEEAGCPIVQVDEPALVEVAEDDAARRAYAESQRRLLDGTEVHAMLAIVGGDADRAGAATVFDAPYASLFVDLIAGPDNWRLVRQAPRDRGIVCGVVPIEPDRRIDPPLLLWAAQYAASSNARGLARVGLATAGSLAGLPWDEAVARMRLLGDAARMAEAAPAVQRAGLDPRAVARPRRRLDAAVPVPPPDSRGRRPRPIERAATDPADPGPEGD